MLERMWRKGDPCPLLVGMYIGIATVEKSQMGGNIFKIRIFEKTGIQNIKQLLKLNNKKTTQLKCGQKI